MGPVRVPATCREAGAIQGLSGRNAASEASSFPTTWLDAAGQPSCTCYIHMAGRAEVRAVKGTRYHRVQGHQAPPTDLPVHLHGLPPESTLQRPVPITMCNRVTSVLCMCLCKMCLGSCRPSESECVGRGLLSVSRSQHGPSPGPLGCRPWSGLGRRQPSPVPPCSLLWHVAHRGVTVITW